MANSFFMVLIDDVPTRFEKARIIEIEPADNGGSKIIMVASHEAEEPIIYFTPEPYEDVMKSFLS